MSFGLLIRNSQCVKGAEEVINNLLTIRESLILFGGCSLFLISFLRTFTEQWNMTLFEIQWNANATDEELETFKIDPRELQPTLSTNYRNGIALFAVRQTDEEGYCAKN